MEKKGLSKRQSSFWPVFNSKRINKSYLGKFNLSSRFKFFRNLRLSLPTAGFTLIELLVVMTMLSVMVSFLLIFINPFKQITKARDAQKEQSLKEIVNALDTYYNDNNQYPVSVDFGSTWQTVGNVYMKEVPQDPDCATGGPCFSYLTDPQSPQWNVLFAKITNAPNSSVACALANLNNCLPSNYADSGYNYCLISGKVDCSFVSVQTLPPDAGAGTGNTGNVGVNTPTPSPVPINTPTPTIAGVACTTYYALSGNGPFGPLCNNLSNDPSSQCTIHGGVYTCYSRSDCTAPLCR